MHVTNWFELTVGLVNLCLLYFVVKAFVIDPLKVVAKERHDKAKADMAKAEDLHQEALGYRERYQKLMSGLEAEKAEIAAAAQADALKVRARIAEEAETEARYVVTRAQSEAKGEREAAVAEIRAKVADETVARARRMLEQSLDAPARRDILDNFLTKVVAGDAR